MKYLFAFLFIASIAACESKTTSNSTDDNKGSATSTSASADMDALNAESKECIRIMNRAETDKQQALANGDTAGAEAAQKTIDSAARANVMIGQKMQDAKAD